MRINPAASVDLESILKIDAELSDEKNYENPQGFYEESIAHNRVLVAQKGNEIMGFLVYQILWGNTPFLALVKVPKVSQNKKVGSQLVQALETQLKTLGFKKYISSAQTFDFPGQVFHSKLGFQNIGTLDMIFGSEEFFIKDL